MREVKRCPMCDRPGRWLREVCAQCYVWWDYHFISRRHGPGYFVEYVARRKRALQRVSFATQAGARAVITSKRGRRLRAV